MYATILQKNYNHRIFSFERYVRRKLGRNDHFFPHWEGKKRREMRERERERERERGKNLFVNLPMS